MAINLIILLMFLFSGATASFSQETKQLAWHPLPLEGTFAIFDDSKFSDTEKVAALTQHLDQRISLAPVENPTGYKPDPTSDYVFLIRYIAMRDNRTNAPGRPEAIQAVLTKLDTMKEIVNKQEVRTYLYVALAYAGGEVHEVELLSLLDNPQTPNLIVAIVLEALNRSNVPIRALPKLIELTSHPWNYINNEPGIGPDNPRRVHPIREAACVALRKLGLKCEKVLTQDKEIDPEWKVRLPTTVIEIDRKSLVSKLREWLLSDDPKTWQAAAEVVHKIPGDDVQTMLANLLEGNQLSAEKKQALAKEAQ